MSAIGSTIIYIFKECQQSAQSLDQSADSEGESRSSKKHSLDSLIHLRDELLDIITERTRDVNSFTRAAVLRVWCTLLEKEVIPVNRIGTVAELGVDRLCDKTAIVRKGAIGLITCLLDYNPFSGDLNADHYKNLKSQLEKAIADRMDFIRNQNRPDSSSQARRLSCVKDLLNEDEDQEEDQEEEEEEETEDISAYSNDSEIYRLTTELSKCHSCLELLEAINTAIPTINLMLISKTSSDVIEALKFFTRAVNFGINGSANCLLASLSLIWHQDESIQTECLNSFLNVFITDGATNSAPGGTGGGTVLPPNEIANNLVTLAARLVAEFSYSEIISLEKIISEIFKRKFLPNSEEVISALWSLVSFIFFYSVHFSSPQALAAHHSQQQQQGHHLHHHHSEQGQKSQMISGPLFVLKMISSFGVDVGFIQVGKIKFICNSCFPESSDPLAPTPYLDLESIRIASMCFQSSVSFLDTYSDTSSSSRSSSSGSLSEIQYTLLAASERLVATLSDKYGQWDSIESTRKWFGTCEEAVYALFRLHPSPEEILTRLILNLFLSWKQSSEDLSLSTATPTICRLSRFLFLLGQGLLGVLLHTEQMAALAKSMKEKEKQLQVSKGDKENGKESKLAKKKPKGKGKKLDEEIEEEETHGESKGSYQENNEIDAMEEEMGLAAAVDADDEKVTPLIPDLHHFSSIEIQYDHRIRVDLS